MDFKKNDTVKTAVAIDMRGTGGPLIPKGTKATVLKSCRIPAEAKEVWVDVVGSGKRRMYSSVLVPCGYIDIKRTAGKTIKKTRWTMESDGGEALVISFTDGTHTRIHT